MRRQALLDKLSEFLMVEQGGLMLYRAAASRARSSELLARYEEFGRQTARHRDALTRVITRLGGDPNYVSPTAKLAQAKAEALLETARVTGPLSPEEIEANDLENVLIAETKDHADWHVLEMLARTTSDIDVRMALEDAVRSVEAEEDRHLGWAREKLAQMAMRMITLGPAPSPERWTQTFTGPVPPIDEQHPAPIGTRWLLDPAQQSPWTETPIARDMRLNG